MILQPIHEPILIPKYSHLHYLPLMYFLPEDWIDRFPTLRELPRRIRPFFTDEKLMKTVRSKRFAHEVQDAAAMKVFPLLGVRGLMTHYTGESPAYMLAYFTMLWIRWLDRILDWNLKRLFNYPSFRDIPSFDDAFITDMLKLVVKEGIKEENCQPALDVMGQLPCEEDFQNRESYVRIDWWRRWYHTRSKRVEVIYFNDCTNGFSRDKYSTLVPDPHDMAGYAEAEDYCQRFKAKLSERDRSILEMREDGLTYKEIAEELDYKNHSGVIKRMQAIKKAFLEYRSKQ